MKSLKLFSVIILLITGVFTIQAQLTEARINPTSRLDSAIYEIYYPSYTSGVKRIFSYAEDSSLATVLGIDYNLPLELYSNYFRTNYERDSNGNLTFLQTDYWNIHTQEWFMGEKVESTFNEYNHSIMEKRSFYDTVSNEWIVEQQSETQYSPEGIILGSEVKRMHDVTYELLPYRLQEYYYSANEDTIVFSEYNWNNASSEYSRNVYRKTVKIYGENYTEEVYTYKNDAWTLSSSTEIDSLSRIRTVNSYIYDEQLDTLILTACRVYIYNEDWVLNVNTSEKWVYEDNIRIPSERTTSRNNVSEVEFIKEMWNSSNEVFDTTTNSLNRSDENGNTTYYKILWRTELQGNWRGTEQKFTFTEDGKPSIMEEFTYHADSTEPYLYERTEYDTDAPDTLISYTVYRRNDETGDLTENRMIKKYSATSGEILIEQEFTWDDGEWTIYKLNNYYYTFSKKEIIESSYDTDVNNISIYPIPASNYLNCESEGKSEISIFHVNGQLADKFEFYDYLQLPINKLSQGLYLYQVTNKNGSTTGEFVKE